MTDKQTDNREGPSIEIPADVDFLDTDLSGFSYNESLDLGPHGKFDPQAEPKVNFSEG